MKAEHCRGCDSDQLVTLHDFGLQPLAGNYPTWPNSERAAAKYELDLTQCASCGLLQVVNLPPIGEIFNENYRYSSSTVPGLVRHFEEYAAWLSAHLGQGAAVFEFGCNDGVLLEQMKRRGFECSGIDASDNVAEIARSKGLDVKTGFLSPEFASGGDYERKFDLVTCSNVFAHIHDIRSVLDAVRLLLVPGGFFSIEVHDGDVLCKEGQFDTVYHEHLTYFTASTLCALLSRAGFEPFRCEKTKMHGGGIRVLAEMADRSSFSSDPDRNAEVQLLGDFIEPGIQRCRVDLQKISDQSGPLYGYGAAGRSQMFINFTGSDDLFVSVFDDSSFRQGRYIAGTDIPIVPYEGETGECVIILAWNYAPDICKKLRGRFEKIFTILPETRLWQDI